jgi:hypothetical protein
MINISEAVVNPDTAQSMLSHNTGNFRPVNAARVKRYASDMLSGRWIYAGDPIRFDKNGKLIDGQHRLAAIVLSGVAVQMLIIRGVEQEAESVIDKGQPRKNASWLHHAGIKNATHAAAIAKMILCHRKRAWHVQAFGAAYFTDKEVLELAEQHDATIQSAFRLATSVGSKIKLGVTLLSTIMHEAAFPLAAESSPICVEFCHALRDGDNLVKSSPVYLLRERFRDVHASKREGPYITKILATIAWNKTATGQSLKVLKFATSGNAQADPPRLITNVSGWARL